METRQLFLNLKQNPIYKAAFGVNRLENILRHLRFDDKSTRAKRLKQDKLAAFNYIWSLSIQNFKNQFFLGAFTTLDEASGQDSDCQNSDCVKNSDCKRFWLKF